MRLQSNFFRSRVYFFNDKNCPIEESVRVHESYLIVIFLKALGKISEEDVLTIDGKKVYVNQGSKIDKMAKLSEKKENQPSTTQKPPLFREWIRNYLASKITKMNSKQLQTFLETETFYDDNSSYRTSDTKKETGFNGKLLKDVPKEVIEKLDLKKIGGNALCVVQWCHEYLTRDQLSSLPKTAMGVFLSNCNGGFLEDPQNVPVIQQWLNKDLLDERFFNFIEKTVFEKIDVNQIHSNALKYAFAKNAESFSVEQLKELFKNGKLGGAGAKVALNALKNGIIGFSELTSASELQVEAFFIDISFPSRDIVKELLKKNKVSAKLWEKWATNFSLHPKNDPFRQFVLEIDFRDLPDEQLKKCLDLQVEQKQYLRHFIRLLPKEQLQNLIDRGLVPIKAASALSQEVFEQLDFFNVESDQLNILLEAKIESQSALYVVTIEQFNTIKDRSELSSKIQNSFEQRKNQMQIVDINIASEVITNWITDEQWLKVDLSTPSFEAFELMFRKRFRCLGDNNNEVYYTVPWDNKKLNAIVKNKGKIEEMGTNPDNKFEIQHVFKMINKKVYQSIDLENFTPNNLKYFFDAQRENITQKQLQVFYDKGDDSHYLDCNDYDWLANNRPEFIQGLKISDEEEKKLKQTYQCEAFAYSKKAQEVWRKGKK